MSSNYFPHEIFKAYDIRGIVNRALDGNMAQLIGKAIASEVIAQGGNSIIIGRDGRLSGPTLAAALADGIQSMGVEVVDIGLAPSPLVYYACHELGIGSCVAITGSHNPPNYNGFKMVINGTTLSTESIQQLKQRILNKDFIALDAEKGSYTTKTITENYINRICSDISLQKPSKVVIDCGNGVAGVTAPSVFKQLGCEVIELFSEVDGNFPNHHPDPSQESNLIDLKEAITQHNADFGLAFDGDGDRLGVVSKSGEVIWPDRVMVLFAQDILNRNPGAEIIYDVKCSRNLPKAIKAKGGVATMWRTGHSYIKAKLKSSGAAFAGEMSGHFFFKERWYGFDDGVYAGARLVELISQSDDSACTIFDSIEKSISTPELKIDFNEGEHYDFMRKIVNQAQFDDAEISTIDGLRVDFDYGFGLIRASNTTPILVLRFEADDANALDSIKRRFAELIQSIDANITLPF